jgi:hypothetical protein
MNDWEAKFSANEKLPEHEPMSYEKKHYLAHAKNQHSN